MSPLVVVALTTETARIYAERRGRTDAVLLATGSRTVDLVEDTFPAARDVVLLDGWDRGRYARVVEAQIRRALGRRSGDFDQCQRDTAFAAA